MIPSSLLRRYRARIIRTHMRFASSLVRCRSRSLEIREAAHFITDFPYFSSGADEILGSQIAVSEDDSIVSGQAVRNCMLSIVNRTTQGCTVYQ